MPSPLRGLRARYDVTSTDFEGRYQASDIVGFGYDGGEKKGHEQIIIGL